MARALAKDLNERYRSAQELIDDLRAVLAGDVPEHAAAGAPKTLVSAHATGEVTLTTNRAPTPLGSLEGAKRTGIAIGAALAVVLVLVVFFRSGIQRELDYWEARRASAARSEPILEALVDEHPDFERGRALLAEVSAELLDEKHYAFELQSGPVTCDTWKRYQRVFEAARRAASGK